MIHFGHQHGFLLHAAKTEIKTTTTRAHQKNSHQNIHR